MDFGFDFEDNPELHTLPPLSPSSQLDFDDAYGSFPYLQPELGYIPLYNEDEVSSYHEIGDQGFAQEYTIGDLPQFPYFLEDDQPLQYSDESSPVSFEGSSEEESRKRERNLPSAKEPSKKKVVQKVLTRTMIPELAQNLKRGDFRPYETVLDRESPVFGFLEAIQYLFEEPSSIFPDFKNFPSVRSLYGDFLVSPNHKNTLSMEQQIQFPEFRDRTFDLLGSNDQEKFSNFIPSPRRGVRINPEKLKIIMTEDPSRIQLVDARFEYEYKGGTIGLRHRDSFLSVLTPSFAAINVNEFWDIEKVLETFWDADRNPRFLGKTLVIFCEFSSLRGPGLYRNVTLLDHLLLYEKYTKGLLEEKISYPEIYILDGGFEHFHRYLGDQGLLAETNSESFILNPENLDLDGNYVSEFHQNSEKNWKSKKSYFRDQANYASFFEKVGLSNMISIWNPFKSEYDTFTNFKRILDNAKEGGSLYSRSGDGPRRQRLGLII